MSRDREFVRGLRDHIEQTNDNKKWVAYGIVKQVRKDDQMIIVSILPEELDTNWLRVSRLASGDDVFIGGLPEVGQEVICLLMGGDPNEVVILDAYPPAEDNTLSETFNDEKDFFIIPRHGGKIKFTQDGIILDPGNLTVYLGGQSGAKKLVTEDFVNNIYNLHVHPGIGTPTTQLGSDAQMTTKVKGV